MSQENIDRAYDAAPDDWKEAALFAVFEVALDNETFTPDDVWLAGLESPPEPRAFGGVMQRAKAMGICEAMTCGECRQPVRRESVRGHGGTRVVTVWRSLIYGELDG